MPDQPFSVDRPLPEGVRDLLFADAATLRGMAASLRATWNAWGYREIILPTFEYAATLSTDVGAGLDAEMYRFFDRHGRTLALRPDMTIPTARVVGTRLYDQPKPLRLSYIGSVFRYEPPRAGRQHEFIQAGVELCDGHDGRVIGGNDGAIFRHLFQEGEVKSRAAQPAGEPKQRNARASAQAVVVPGHAASGNGFTVLRRKALDLVYDGHGGHLLCDFIIRRSK